MVHGTRDTVNAICDHPDIRAIAFVGSNVAGKYIYARGSANGKRVQVSNMLPTCQLLSMGRAFLLTSEIAVITAVVTAVHSSKSFITTFVP